MTGVLFVADAYGNERPAVPEKRDVWAPPSPAQEYREEQTKQLERVKGALADKIRDFLTPLLRGTGLFYANQLHTSVGGAPASADRVMRALRASGEVEYEVVDRSRSLYRVTRVA